jgi:hypothetical protein
MQLTRFKPKWWSSLLVLVIFCVSLIQPAFAATTSNQGDLVNLLRQYNIVRGDDTGDLQLGALITRAQFATILVRITGHEDEAANLKGLSMFSDTKGHWAEGEINAARIHGLVQGFEDGSFRPEEPVTYAQALTLVLRMVGREPAADNWPTSALFDAMELSIIPPGFTGMAQLGQPAVRGDIFASVGLALTTVKTAEGQTYLQKFIDSTAPDLTITSSTTANNAVYELKGTVKDASRVEVNGEAATVTGDAFAKSVSLQIGANTLVVDAYDLAGNKTTKSVVVNRASPAASITINGPAKVQIGGTAAYTIRAFDANQTEVTASGFTARVTGNIGTFNATTGTFTAANTAASGKIEVTLGTATAVMNVQVLGASTAASRLSVHSTMAPYTKPVTVTVQVLDANGALVTDDYGRGVSLTATGVSGLTVTPAIATTVGGEATFTVKGGEAGTVMLTASSLGLGTAGGNTELATTTRVVLVTDQDRIPTNGAQTAHIRAELRDDNNNPVSNKSGKDIYINLQFDGPASVLNSRVRIAPNASSSAQTQSDGLLAATFDPGTIIVTGTLEDSSLRYTVERVTVTTYTPSAGSGARLRVIPMTSRVTVGSGDPAEFMVQLIDSQGNPISASSYAFQVEVTTSNNEPKDAGVPQGMRVQIGDNVSLNPVSNGKADGDDVIARTDTGSALIKVYYDKPGTVILKAVPASGTSEAYNTDGEVDSAVSSSSSWIGEESKGEADFRVTANSIKITADSDLFGKDAPAISHKAGSSRGYTLNAYVAWYDTASTEPEVPRYWVPGELRTLELFKNGTKVATAEARDGKATFTVTASATADHEDVYVVKDAATTGKLMESDPLFVRTEGRAPNAAGFPVTRGLPSHMSDAVLASDSELEIDLPADSTQRYVVAKVYAENGSLLYTSGPIDVSSGTPTLKVPKEKVGSGTKSIYIRYRNGFGETSDKGVLSYPITVYSVSSSVAISSAKYDAVNQILYVYGSGFSKDDLVYGEKLELADPTIIDPTPSDGDHPGIANLAGAYATWVSSSTFKLELAGLATSELGKIANFAGSVKLSSKVGWISKINGQMGGEDTGNAVTPMAYIEYAAYDRTNRVLVIYGRGFKSGTVRKDNLMIGTHYLSETGMSVSVPRDTEIWVTLNAAAKAEVETTLAISLIAEDAWFTDGLSTPVGQMAGKTSIDVLGYVKATKVTFNGTTGEVILEGTGFANGKLSTVAGLVKIIDDYRTTGSREIALTPVKVENGKVYFEIPADRLTDFNTNFRYRVFLVAEDGWFQVPVYPNPDDTTIVQWRDAPAIPLNTAPKLNK